MSSAAPSASGTMGMPRRCWCGQQSHAIHVKEEHCEQTRNMCLTCRYSSFGFLRVSTVAHEDRDVKCDQSACRRMCYLGVVLPRPLLTPIPTGEKSATSSSDSFSKKNDEFVTIAHEYAISSRLFPSKPPDSTRSCCGPPIGKYLICGKGRYNASNRKCSYDEKRSFQNYHGI